MTTKQNLKDSDKCFKKIIFQERIEAFKAHFAVEKGENARQRTIGYTIAPSVNGQVQFHKLRRDRHSGSLREELSHRGEQLAARITFTDMKMILQKSELAVLAANPNFEEVKTQSGWFNEKGLPKFFQPQSAADFSTLNTGQ